MATEQDSFLDENYEAPASGGGYTKLEMGENRFRVLSSPLMVWVIWANGQVKRVPYNKDEKPALPEGDNPSVKHAWELVVYNYKTQQIEIFELDKMTVINPITTHSKDPDWGHPKKYDITITKSGSGKDGTKYAFVAKPHKEVSEDVKEAYFNTPIDLGQLLVENGNPFLPATSGESAPAANAGPTPEQVAAAAKAAADKAAAAKAAAAATDSTPAAGAKKPPF